MTFGTAIIGQALSGPRGGRRHRLFDCGRHGKLTCTQAAKIAGVSRSAIQRRVLRGVKGADLCAPELSHRERHSRRAPCQRPALITAIRLLRHYPDRLPTYKELMAEHHMSKSRACQWRQALRDAREVA